jgi:hypothetical protein
MRAVDWSGAGRQKQKKGETKNEKKLWVCPTICFNILLLFFFFVFCFSRMRALTNTLETLVGGGERFFQLTDDEFRFFFVRRCCVIEGQTKRRVVRVWWVVD